MKLQLSLSDNRYSWAHGLSLCPVFFTYGKCLRSTWHELADMEFSRGWTAFDTMVASAGASSDNKSHLLIIPTILSIFTLSSADVNPHHAKEAKEVVSECPFGIGAIEGTFDI